MNFMAGVFTFQVRDRHTREPVYVGSGNCAQEVYENYRRAIGEPIGLPDDSDFESDDITTRLAAYRDLAKADSWIDDDTIIMTPVTQ